MAFDQYTTTHVGFAFGWATDVECSNGKGRSVMDITPLPFRPPAWGNTGAGRGTARRVEGRRSRRDPDRQAEHPRFLDPHIPWLPKELSDVRSSRRHGSSCPTAQLIIARWYDFESWPRLAEYVEAVTLEGSPVSRFESAVEAVISGEVSTLASLLREHPGLVRARSTRVTHFDPPIHRATLLHYVAANGVEGYRQKTPHNAVDVAKTLLEAGAEVDAWRTCTADSTRR